MSKYRAFIFKDYSFDAAAKKLSLQYSFDNSISFTETFTFDIDFADFSAAALDRACQLLFFVAGVSYYKAYLPEKIIVESGDIDQNLAEFLADTYQKGLGEFFYVNKLDPRTEISFPVTATHIEPVSHSGSGYLIGLGGGKDSLVSVEVLCGEENTATWSLGHRAQLEPLVKQVGIPHYWVDRKIDPLLLKLNDQDAMNGHVPISAIIAATGVVVAVLSGKRDVVVSNESSASEATLTYENVEINHQYSKSLDYEIKFKFNLNLIFGDSVRYYSLLRPLTELRIAELFSKTGFDRYKTSFSSCNLAFRQNESTIFWCGRCAKCAFVFLVLSPFIDRKQLEDLFGKNLLLDPELKQTYEQLLGISGDKPLECVGEVKESRAAMELVKPQYNGMLDHFVYELPENYDYRSLSEHVIPDEVYAVLERFLKNS